MPYVDPQTIHNPSTGGIAPASWGDGVRDALQYLSGGYAHCSIKESTAQSIPNTTWTALTSDEENSDIGGMHSTSSNTSRATVPTGEGGLYVMHASISFAANATGARYLGFGKNGANPTFNLQSMPTLGGASGTELAGILSMVLAAGDYVQCMAFQNSGGALNCSLQDFSIRWVATA